MMTEARRLLKAEFYKLWVAADGLCRQHLKDHQPNGQNGSSLDTVQNENGILGLVVFYVRCDETADLELFDKSHFERTVAYLEVEPGVYHRYHGAHWRTEAHDNLSAIAVGSVLFDTKHAKEICEHGERTGWCFNNRQPGKFNISQVMHPGVVALLKIAAWKLPAPWEWAWICFGAVINAFKGDKGSSDKQLTWMRFHAIGLRFRRMDVPPYMLISYWLVRLFFFGMQRVRFGGMQGVLSHFWRSAHPIIRWGKLLQ